METNLREDMQNYEATEKGVPEDGVYFSVDPLRMILDFLKEHHVVTDSVKIHMHCGPHTKYGEKRPSVRLSNFNAEVTFDHDSEWGENLRALKRALGKLDKYGSPPYMMLKKERVFLIGHKIARAQDEKGVLTVIKSPVEMTVTFYVLNSFECETKCVPKRSALMSELADEEPDGEDE